MYHTTITMVHASIDPIMRVGGNRSLEEYQHFSSRQPVGFEKLITH